MKDTPQVVEDLYRMLLMKRSGVERLKMGCAMFDAARVLARAHLQPQCDVDEDMSAKLFMRTYGGDFEPDMVERIAQKFSVRQGL
jgi:hypothetical protein